jgi:carbon-monoxide dehydrogenase small subunit
VSAQVAPHETLVEVLRAEFGLHGARESCGQGMCGCCTVLVNARAVSGCCISPSLWRRTPTCRTIEEGISALDAVQQAFVEAGRAAMRFCTPGFV